MSGSGRKTRDEVVFWRSLEELRSGCVSKHFLDGEFGPHAQDPLLVPPEGVSRRRFLGLLGASAALAGATACLPPSEEEKVVPYTRQPEGIVPGKTVTYATAWQEGLLIHGLLAMTREGRPVHLAGNDAFAGSGGAITPRAQAQILSLYDPDRLRSPLMEGKAASWDEVLASAVQALRDARSGGKTVLLVTEALLSPSRRLLIEELQRALPALRHVAWEPLADHAALTASAASMGHRRLPLPALRGAKVVLSIGNDFLGSGCVAPSVLRDYASGRTVSKRDDAMSRHYSVEGRMTLTGSNADVRLPMAPSRMARFAFAVARELHDEHEAALPPGIEAAALPTFDAEACGVHADVFHALAADLAHAGRHAAVLPGPDAPMEAHVAALLLQNMLGSDHVRWVSAPRTAPPQEMTDLMKDLALDRVSAALVWGANPILTAPGSKAWAEAFARVPFRAFFGDAKTETADACGAVFAAHHWLESWGDFQAGEGTTLFQQPVLQPLHNTMQAEDALLRLAAELTGGETLPYREFLKRAWRRIRSGAGEAVPFDAFWNGVLYDGVLSVGEPDVARTLNAGAVADAAAKASAAKEGYELVLHPDARIYDGRHGNNGWLQEMPEPVSKQVWGNALSMSAADAEAEGFRDGDLIELAADGTSFRIPAVIQPGQAKGVISAALGFGRRTGNVASGVGADLFPLAFGAAGTLRFNDAGRSELVRTQEHHAMMGRDLARVQTLADYAHHGPPHGAHHPEADLYPVQDFPRHHWGMAIDLSLCVGCGACLMACQSENNVPVVGPEQVAKGREMHWIRIDRYYAGDPENPAVVHQPVLCMHCDSAPCENVCPVNATTHSDEGLNQMAYNRCVGTRYCANNCPYKVRRFNFFDFFKDLQSPAELAFNPEVSIRPRGVMEKCTFCIQRIEAGKQRAKREGRTVTDGDIVPACAAACPTGAILFGDLKDPESRVSKQSDNERGYKMLDAELGVKPSITYLTRLRNTAEAKDDQDEEGHHG